MPIISTNQVVCIQEFRTHQYAGNTNNCTYVYSRQNRTRMQWTYIDWIIRNKYAIKSTISVTSLKANNITNLIRILFRYKNDSGSIGDYELDRPLLV